MVFWLWFSVFVLSLSCGSLSLIYAHSLAKCNTGGVRVDVDCTEGCAVQMETVLELCLRWQLIFINLPTRLSPMCLSSTPRVLGATPGQTRRTRFLLLERIQTNTLQADSGRTAPFVWSVSGPRVHKKLCVHNRRMMLTSSQFTSLLWAEGCRTFQISSSLFLFIGLPYHRQPWLLLFLRSCRGRFAPFHCSRPEILHL